MGCAVLNVKVDY